MSSILSHFSVSRAHRARPPTVVFSTIRGDIGSTCTLPQAQITHTSTRRMGGTRRRPAMQQVRISPGVLVQSANKYVWQLRHATCLC